MDGSGAAASAASVDLASVRERFRLVRASLASTFRERDSAIECILLGALSGCHALLAGPPGTAKSALLTGFLDNLPQARRFGILLGAFSTDSDVFGPVKLSALKNDRLERATDGRLAKVEAAFLDEVFKASGPLLNTMLGALNERVYDGGKIPLRFVVAASNELPEEENLAAVYDRFLLRDLVDYVSGDAVFLSMIQAPPRYVAPTAITVAEWDAARADVDTVKLPEAVAREMLRIRTELKKNGVQASDRRWIALTRVLKAAAWLDGEPEVNTDHIAVLRFGLWNKPADRTRVEGVLGTVDRSAVQKAVDIIDRALAAYNARSVRPEDQMQTLPKAAADLMTAAAAVKKLLAAGVSKRAAAKIASRMEELRAAHKACTDALAARYDMDATA